MSSSTAEASAPSSDRKRSVQFSSPNLSGSRSRPPTNSYGDDDASPGHHTGESSADEITPIISHPRHKNTNRYDGGGGGGGGGGSSSNPTFPSVGNNNDDDSTKASTTSTSRKRKSKLKPSPSSSSSNRDGPTTSASDNSNNKKSPDEEDDDDDDPTSSSSPWTSYLRSTAEKYGSLSLENKGSVARDHLALERTFLAWLRTSLAFASIGIAVTQLFRLNTTIKSSEGLKPVPHPPQDRTRQHLRQMGKPLGATFLGIAMVVLLVGARRYFEAQHWIVRGMFPASRGSVLLVTGIAAALIVSSLVVVVVVEPSVFEKR